MTLWAQIRMPAAPDWLVPTWLKWLFVLGEPSISIAGVAGGLITWIKVVSLFALLAWLLSWVVSAYQAPRHSKSPKADWLDIAALVATILGCVCCSRWS